MDTLLLQQIINDQRKLFSKKDRGILRDFVYKKYLDTKQITVVSGVRRAGKSTLLLHFGDNFDNFHFVSFDDDRFLHFDSDDFNTLLIELKKNNNSKVIILDEVQNIKNWERFVRRLYDEEYKIFISGSNAKLLSSELATHLTGRYFKKELYPFSFKEYLIFKCIDFNSIDSETTSQVLSNFDYYMENGGFPEFVKFSDSEYLSRIYEDIIYKDIIVRFNIRNVNNFKNLVNYLFSNFTKEYSYNSLAGILGVSSTTSVREYISHLCESYLVFEIHRFDFSLKRQYISNKKIYVIDNGLRNAVSFRLTPDKGKLLENLVFLELKRRFSEIYFYITKNNYEIDFLVKNERLQIIQVCYDISSKVTREREVRAIQNAMDELNINDSYLLTYNTRERLNYNNKLINIVPVWEWLLNNY